jgi:DNA-binding NtrC family response regulator
LGRFELADGGTLFLDEIGEIPLATQVKLLRVLEEREVTRVGGTTPIRLDVRVVAATNQPLRQLVEEGHFRSDLYYRLNVLRIYLPPLRERRSDIPMLVRRFVRQFSAQHDRPFHGISADAMRILVEYAWPGNVRQLRNLVESMVVLAPGRVITAEDIPRDVREGGRPSFLPVRIAPAARQSVDSGGRELEFIVRSLVELKLQVEELRRRVEEGVVPGLGVASGRRGELAGEVSAEPALAGRGAAAGALPLAGAESVLEGGSEAIPLVSALEPPSAGPSNVLTIVPGMTMAEIERGAIEAALRETGGNRRRAAELLGIGERTMYRKIREYQIPDSFATTLD